MLFAATCFPCLRLELSDADLRRKAARELRLARDYSLYGSSIAFCCIIASLFSNAESSDLPDEVAGQAAPCGSCAGTARLRFTEMSYPGGL